MEIPDYIFKEFLRVDPCTHPFRRTVGDPRSIAPWKFLVCSQCGARVHWSEKGKKWVKVRSL
jgi:hypothetical protein